jgi:hypothetical protein
VTMPILVLVPPISTAPAHRIQIAPLDILVSPALAFGAGTYSAVNSLRYAVMFRIMRLVP